MKVILLFLFSFNLYASEVATFAGGCFWCMEAPFEKIKGVSKVISGFSGGKSKNPSYRDVAYGKTKHIEAIQVIFDPKVVSYKDLVTAFWINIDPTDDGGQFVDRGHHYTTAIFFHNAAQKKIADISKKLLIDSKKFKDEIVTPIIKYDAFFAAGDEHQDFYKKNDRTKKRYKSYRAGSGRDEFLRDNWITHPFNKSSKKRKYVKHTRAQLKKKLTSLQFEVTQNDGTEKPFKNPYWNSKEGGFTWTSAPENPCLAQQISSSLELAGLHSSAQLIRSTSESKPTVPSVLSDLRCAQK